MQYLKYIYDYSIIVYNICKDKTLEYLSKNYNNKRAIEYKGASDYRLDSISGKSTPNTMEDILIYKQNFIYVYNQLYRNDNCVYPNIYDSEYGYTED